MDFWWIFLFSAQDDVTSIYSGQEIGQNKCNMEQGKLLIMEILENPT